MEMPTLIDAIKTDPYVSSRCPILFDYGYFLGLLLHISVHGESKFLNVKSITESMMACMEKLRALPLPAREPLVADLILYFESFYSRLSCAATAVDGQNRSPIEYPGITSFESCVAGIITRSRPQCPDGAFVVFGRACGLWECDDNCPSTSARAKDTMDVTARLKQSLLSSATRVNITDAHIVSSLKHASVASAKAPTKPLGTLQSILQQVLQELLPSFWQLNPEGKSKVAGVEVNDVDYQLLAALRRSGAAGLRSEEQLAVNASAAHRLAEIRKHPVLSRYVSAKGRACWIVDSIPLPPD
jgi:hypothetical protein